MNMELAQLISLQIERDRRRGFPVDFTTDAERQAQLMRDLVGIVGEVGEFANLLKKVELAQNKDAYVGPSLDEATPQLREELADVSIYLFRLSALLGVDLERAILEKMNVNDARYRDLE
jgi:NTP pyrophosphatase (non-canonical NTP hydrolase)